MRSLVIGAALLLWAGAAGADLAIGIVDFPEDPSFPACVGDCNHDGRVTVDELMRGVSDAQHVWTDSLCGYAVPPRVDHLTLAVSHALTGCE